jgi:HK97 family phage portal protein
MKLFGLEITRTKTAVPATTTPSGWSANFGLPFWNSGSSSWFPLVQEPWTGAWQRNQELRAETLLSFHALYRCITLISHDISKCRMCLVEQNPTTGIWDEVDRNSPYWPVLIKPNRYQTRIQFFDEWLGSKLIYGNTFVLKERDARGIVVAMYVLNPLRTKILVAPDGSIYYELQADTLNQIAQADDPVRVPASEIIHDRYKPLYHALYGISPISACALSGMLGLNIQANSATFFQNSSRPGGILTAPERINDETARRLKEHWEANYTGNNAGKIAVLGDGLKFEAMRETATDAQLIEQLKITAENVCTAFGVPPYMIGIGAPPAYNNIEALSQQYYSQCLQIFIESIELLLDEGLNLTSVAPRIYGTEFDLDDLLRMDTSTKSKTWGDLVKQGIAAPNEARAAFDMMPVEGGDSVYMQQQNFSLEALAKRDSNDPFAKPPPAPAADSSSTDSGNGADGADGAQPTEDNADGGTSTAALADRILRLAKFTSRTAGV